MEKHGLGVINYFNPKNFKCQQSFGLIVQMEDHYLLEQDIVFEDDNFAEPIHRCALVIPFSLVSSVIIYDMSEANLVKAELKEITEKPSHLRLVKDDDDGNGAA